MSDNEEIVGATILWNKARTMYSAAGQPQLPEEHHTGTKG